MTDIRVGARVRASVRRSIGTVLHHHPTLPAWIVDFKEDRKYQLAWYDETLKVVA